MSNKYIEQGLSKEALLEKLARCNPEKKALIQEALDSLKAGAVKAAPEPVVKEAPAPEPVVEAAPVAEEAAPEAKPKPKKRTYRRKKSTTTKE